MSDKLTYGGSWLYIEGSSVSFGEDPYNRAVAAGIQYHSETFDWKTAST